MMNIDEAIRVVENCDENTTVEEFLGAYISSYYYVYELLGAKTLSDLRGLYNGEPDLYEKIRGMAKDMRASKEYLDRVIKDRKALPIPHLQHVTHVNNLD